MEYLRALTTNSRGIAQENISLSPDAVVMNIQSMFMTTRTQPVLFFKEQDSGNPHLVGGISMCITGMANNHKFILLLAGIELPATC